MQALDEQYMCQAISEGEKGRCTAPPNPWVGCVIVKYDGCETIIGRGYHRKAGEPHAEVRAIQDVQARYGDRAEEVLKGSTVYVTLEPCSHTGRTGPCMLQLIKYEVGRVVVGCLDPDTKVSGRGIAGLREAGIVVEMSSLTAEVEKSLRPYLHQRRTGRPWVVYKTATSLDSNISDHTGKSQWITGEKSRVDAHERWRATSQAIVVGSKTADLDNPSLTVRHYPDYVITELITPPLRCVVGRNVRLGSNLSSTRTGPILAFTNNDNISCFNSTIYNQPSVVKIGLDTSGQLDFIQVLTELGKRGVIQVLVEGGATLGASLLQNNLVNQLVVYQSPIILGSGTPAFPIQPRSLDQASKWTLSKTTVLDSDVCLEYIN